jgi:hypothetical protein
MFSYAAKVFPEVQNTTNESWRRVDDEMADRLKKALEQTYKVKEADHYRRRMLWP